MRGWEIRAVTQTKSPFVARTLASRLVTAEQVADCIASLDSVADDSKIMDQLVRRGMLTPWQAGLIQEGRTQGFLVEQYKILEPLGAGGMGQIYRALDTKSGWHVAIKVLPKKAATPQAVRRFRREGEAAIRVQHEHLVRTYRLGQQGDTYFLVMELVVGTDLAKHIAHYGTLSVGLTARIGYAVALALEHARRQGIVHRDVKPSNILLTLKQQVKLTDLGLAKFFGSVDESATDLTRSGAVLGTIDFMAPEQAEDSKRADSRSDIYSLGCTLYKCLTGRAPFADGTHVQRILAHRQQEPEPITLWNPDVPVDFAQLIVRKMMAKSRADRFQTPAEVAAALEPWARQSDQDIMPLPASEVSPAPGRESPGTDARTPGDAADPPFVTVTCSICGTRVDAVRAQYGGRVECPDCGTRIPVPWPRKTPKVKPPNPAEISSYNVLPTSPNPKPLVHLPDYDLLGPDRQSTARSRAPSPGWHRAFWKGALLLVVGAVLGALGVIAVLALSGMLRD
jgi:serine/threonine protein kinase